MPRPLSDAVISAIRERLFTTAPLDLTAEEFDRWVGPRFAAAIAEAEERAKQPSGVDRALDALPTLGGMAGGLVGGAGGTVLGMGVGGIPGAAGGAALGGSAGEALRQLANLVRGQAPRSTGEAIIDIGREGAIQGGLEAVGGAVAKGVGSGATALYRGYLKPSLSRQGLSETAQQGMTRAAQATQTAVDEGLPLTRAGVVKGEGLITALRSEVDRITAAAPGKIDLPTIANRIRAWAKRRYDVPGAAEGAYAQALAVADRIDHAPSLRVGTSGAHVTGVRATDATRIKRALDEAITPTQFGIQSTAATTTAEKFARRKMRVAIEKVAPGVGQLNARESKLIDAARAVKHAVEREANQQKLYGGKTLAAMGLGGGTEYARSGDVTNALAATAATRALFSAGSASHVSILAARLAKDLKILPANALRLAAYVIAEDGDAEREAP